MAWQVAVVWQGVFQEQQAIFIKSVVANGAAERVRYQLCLSCPLRLLSLYYILWYYSALMCLVLAYQVTWIEL